MNLRYQSSLSQKLFGFNLLCLLMKFNMLNKKILFLLLIAFTNKLKMIFAHLYYYNTLNNIIIRTQKLQGSDITLSAKHRYNIRISTKRVVQNFRSVHLKSP